MIDRGQPSTTETARAAPTRPAIFYVEDPGAANFMQPLVAPMETLGAEVQVICGGECSAAFSGHAIAVQAGETLIEHASVLVVGTSENRDSQVHDLVAQARAATVPTIGVVDAQPNAAERFRGRKDEPLAHAPDWLLVPDDATRQVYESLGYDRGRIHVVGHPHYDQVLKEKRALDTVGRASIRRACFPRAANDQRVIVFLAELSDGLVPGEFQRGTDYTLAGWGDDDRRTHVVLQELLDALDCLDPAPHTVLRLHPKNSPDEFARYGRLIDQVSVTESALEVVFAADLVVGMSTMLLAAAAVMGSPALAILPRRLERNWLPAVVGPQLPCVYTRPDIGPALNASWGDGQKITRPEPGAADRAVAAISRVAGLSSGSHARC